MITGLDHVVVLTGDIEAATAAYQTLFARQPAWRNSGDGADRVLFTLDNMSLELMAPSGEGANADRIRSVLAAQGEGGTATAKTALGTLRATGRPTVTTTLTERKPSGRRVQLLCSN